VLFQRNGGSVQVWDGGNPISAGAGEALSMSICNYNNIKVGSYTVQPGTQLVPAVLRNVGDGAKVQVDVVNSGNVEVSTELIIGMIIAEGVQTPDQADAALIRDIVSGHIGNYVDIRVYVRDSANVIMTGSNTIVHIGKGTLLDEIINGDVPSFGGYFEVEVMSSANIFSITNPYAVNTRVYIRDGQLDDEAVDFDAGSNSRIYVRKNGCANVNARELNIWDGELSDEAVDIINASSAHVEIILENCSNFNGVYLRIVDGELVDEAFDSLDIHDSFVSVQMTNVGNVIADTVYINEGELIDETIDANVLVNSEFRVRIYNAANVKVNSLLEIIEGELIDEVIDALTLNNVRMTIEIENVANVWCPGAQYNPRVSITNGELYDAVLDANGGYANSIAIWMRGNANIYARKSNVVLNGASALIKTVVSGNFVDVSAGYEAVGQFLENQCY
jgi:hypothetical protein